MSTFTYTREHLELLLGSSLWRRQDERPEATGPRDASTADRRGTTDPRRASDLWAMRADLQRAWRGASITESQRQALLLRHGLELTLTECGDWLCISAGAAGDRVERGTARLLDYLNGTQGERLAELHELDRAA